MIMKNTHQNLFNNVKKVMAWFEENHMRVNPEKFNFTVFGTNTDDTGRVLDNHLEEPGKNKNIRFNIG